MKLIKSLTAMSFILALVVLINCKSDGGGDKEPDLPGQAKAEQLALGTWGTSAGGVTVNNTPRDEWDSFALSFTVNTETYEGGSYSASGIPSDDGATSVWQSSGTWAFAKNGESLNLSTLYRDGDESTPVSLNVDVNEDTGEGVLSLSFNVPAETGTSSRVAGFDGSWVFTFELQ